MLDAQIDLKAASSPQEMELLLFELSFSDAPETFAKVVRSDIKKCAELKHNYSDRDFNSSLLALHAGSTQATIDLIDVGGLNVNQRFKSGATPILCATNAETVQALVDRNADINVSMGGLTPLIIPVHYGREDVVRILANVPEADLNFVAPRDNTNALGLAVGANSKNIVKILVDAGAKADAEMFTFALSKAIKCDQREIVTDLIRAGVEINKGAKIPVVTASNYGHLECLKILVEAGAKIGRPRDGCELSNGLPPLHLSISLALPDIDKMPATKTTNKIEAIRYLISQGADPSPIRYASHIGSGEVSALCLAAHAPELHEVVKDLIASGADVNVPMFSETSSDSATTPESTAKSPLFVAIRANATQSAISLTEFSGTNVNWVDTNNYNALHNAVLKNNVEIVAALLARKDLKLDQITVRGQSALDIANNFATQALSIHQGGPRCWNKINRLFNFCSRK